jgi:glycosyltransferase involved in cell wall biosynthesis
MIAAIPERFHSVQPLLYSLLEAQSVARMPDVELLYFMDSRKRPVGAKRNDLLAMARGEYVSFIDDDDEVASDYVRRIHDTIVSARKSDPRADVICFPQRATLKPHGVTHECTYSLAHWRDRKPEERRQLAHGSDANTLLWSGPPAHTMAWRRETIGDTRFPNKTFGEDVDWVNAVCAKATTEIVLTGAPLYFYKFDEERTATR